MVVAHDGLSEALLPFSASHESYRAFISASHIRSVCYLFNFTEEHKTGRGRGRKSGSKRERERKLETLRGSLIFLHFTGEKRGRESGSERGRASKRKTNRERD